MLHNLRDRPSSRILAAAAVAQSLPVVIQLPMLYVSNIDGLPLLIAKFLS